MAAANNPPQTRANRLRGLELAIEARDPTWDSPASIIARADLFAAYLHTGTKPAEDKK
jgi:hypothetical protein